MATFSPTAAFIRVAIDEFGEGWGGGMPDEDKDTLANWIAYKMPDVADRARIIAASDRERLALREERRDLDRMASRDLDRMASLEKEVARLNAEVARLNAERSRGQRNNERARRRLERSVPKGVSLPSEW